LICGKERKDERKKPVFDFNIASLAPKDNKASNKENKALFKPKEFSMVG